MLGKLDGLAPLVTDLPLVLTSSSRLNLVLPSVCARGLDVKNLILVVNYDCPNHYEDYVHR